MCPSLKSNDRTAGTQIPCAACRSRTDVSYARPVRGSANLLYNAIKKFQTRRTSVRCISPWPQADTRHPSRMANARRTTVLDGLPSKPPTIFGSING